MRLERLFQIVLLLLSQGAASAHALASRVDESGCAPLVRKAHFFHPLIWSGIFPFEGGFIPDPHCLSSKQMALPVSALQLLGRSSGTFQIFGVNPYFNNKSSQIVLLFRSGAELFEYSLEFPRHRGIQAVPTDNDPTVRIFPYEGKLVVLANFDKASGVYVIDLPLHSHTALALNPIGSPIFDDVSRGFESVASDGILKSQFCETTNDFGTFYERFAGKCDRKPNLRYEDFWLHH
jgi:hypothetical protein